MKRIIIVVCSLTSVDRSIILPTLLASCPFYRGEREKYPVHTVFGGQGFASCLQPHWNENVCFQRKKFCIDAQ